MKPDTMLVSAGFLAAFREQWRKQGECHRIVDRWRYELGWNIAPEVVRAFLEGDRPR